jgi:hypothetical protein
MNTAQKDNEWKIYKDLDEEEAQLMNEGIDLKAIQEMNEWIDNNSEIIDEEEMRGKLQRIIHEADFDTLAKFAQNILEVPVLIEDYGRFDQWGYFKIIHAK